jgi:hypothetical protein
LPIEWKYYRQRKSGVLAPPIEKAGKQYKRHGFVTPFAFEYKAISGMFGA